MDSDSDEEKYYVSEDTEDDEPRPASRRSSVSEPPTPDISASSSEDKDDIGNIAGQQPQPWLWTLSITKACSSHLYWGSQREKQGSCTRNERVHST